MSTPSSVVMDQSSLMDQPSLMAGWQELQTTRAKHEIRDANSQAGDYILFGILPAYDPVDNPSMIRMLIWKTQTVDYVLRTTVDIMRKRYAKSKILTATEKRELSDELQAVFITFDQAGTISLGKRSTKIGDIPLVDGQIVYAGGDDAGPQIARPRGPARRRRLGDALRALLQHQCAHDHDRREGRRRDPGPEAPAGGRAGVRAARSSSIANSGERLHSPELAMMC